MTTTPNAGPAADLAVALLRRASGQPGDASTIPPNLDATQLLALDSDLDQLLQRVSDLWWSGLTADQQLAVHVDRLCRSPRPTPIDDLVMACRLATAAGHPVIAVPEYTTMTQALVKPGGLGVWSVEVGNAPRRTGIGGAGDHLGDYGSIRAARAAAWDAVAANRERLRQALRTSASPLARLADRAWQDPVITVWANAHQLAEDDSALVTVHQIAHRARVDTITVRTWLQQPGFPDSTDAVLWHWPQIDQWLDQAGLVPASGYADDRRTIPSDAAF